MTRRIKNWKNFIGAALSILLLAGCASDRLLRERLSNSPSITDERFDKSLENLTGIIMVDGNRILELVNGEAFFPAMIEAIRRAQETIEFENFVWRSGRVSTQFIEALSERAQSGVEVRFLVDALGSTKLSKADIAKLRGAGVRVAMYNPAGWNIFSINHRTHRKTLVVDGKIGFLGGISVADEWLCATDNPGRWRDSNYRMEGPIVAQLRDIFAANWNQSTEEQLSFSSPTPNVSGPTKAACFMSGPDEGERRARRIYLLAIAGAQKSIRLAHSYFVPDNEAMELLLAARQRGVRIEILTPGLVNLNFVRRASRSRWQKLLDAGVEFYEYQPTKYHLKLMIVDDVWVTAGSVNFDARSFRINDEANFIARGAEFAATQIATFESDKRLSKPVDAKEFSGRPLRVKLSEYFMGLFRWQL